MVNFLALLGWASGTEEEIFSLGELVDRFDLSRVHSGGAVFDRERLEWLNGQWLRRLDPGELAERLVPFLAADLAIRQASGSRIVRQPTTEEILPLVPLVQERLPVLGAVGDLVDFVFLDPIPVDAGQLVPRRWDAGTAIVGLEAARAVIEAQGRVSFEADELEGPLRDLAAGRGWKAGDLFMAIRVAITGRSVSPPLFDSMVALGPARTLQRLDAAIGLLRERLGAT